MVKKQTKPSVLPHLPKGMGMPQNKVNGSHDVLLPGQKTLPTDDWKNTDAQQQQLVPGIQHGGGGGGGGQQMVRKQSTISKQGIPWTDRQSKVQIDAQNEPPPMFTAAPRKAINFSTLKESKTQKHVYRMESGIDPVVLLTSRLESWRLAIKNLVGLFKKLAEVETKTSKGLINASKEIILPFRKANGQFLESGGIQDVWSAIRDYTMQHGMMQNEAANYVHGAVIPSLRAIKADIKQMIVQIEKDKSLKSNLIFDSRMQVDKLITRLDRVIESTRRAPQYADDNTDPFLINLGIIHAIRELCDHENRLHDNVLNLQKETGIFEQNIVEGVRTTLREFQQFRVKNKLESEDYIGTVNATFENIQPYTEWNSFVHRNQFNLVMENSGYKTENMVEYPNQDSEYVRAVKIGPLQLKTGITRGWTEGVYLLTPAGFLHGYKTPKHFQTSPLRPNYSIFIPNASIEADEENFETFEIRQNSNKKVSLGGNHFVFRAPTLAENQAWFEALVRIADQFRVIPLLDTTEHGFSSTAPTHRDLPPLPSNILPIEGGETRGAIDNQPHQEDQQVLQQQNGLAAVHEDDEGDGSTTPKQLTHSAQVVHSPNVVTNDDGSSIDNWQSVHDDAGDFDETGSKTVEDEEHDLALAQQHLQDTPATPTAATSSSAVAADDSHLYDATATTSAAAAATDDSHLYNAGGSSKQAAEPAL